MALGGRAAEEIVFNEITTGAGDDLRRVTQMAYGQVSVYGMNDRVGLLSYAKDNNQFQNPYSEATGQMIDEEVRKLVNEMYDRTKLLLHQHREGLEAVAQRLLSQEVLVPADLIELLGPRPFENATTYDQFIENAWKRPGEGSEEECAGTADETIEDPALGGAAAFHAPKTDLSRGLGL